MHAFHRLSVWRKAHELTLRVYRLADVIRGRHPALAAQLLRAVMRIPASIAEGSGRATRKQFSQFLQSAIGSAREAEYFLRLAVDVGAITSKDHAVLEARADEITRMLVGLRKTVSGQRQKRTRKTAVLEQ